MSTGTALMKRVWLALSRAGVTVWRNNTGTGWAGKSIALRAGQTYTARGGERVVFDARPLHAGLVNGSSDLIGFVPVKITEDMVGKTVAVFAAWEVKDGTGRPSKDQKNFVDHVEANGGLGVIVRSEADARMSIEGVRGK